MISKTYSFDESTKTLTVFSNKGVYDFCRDNKSSITDFNYKVIIDKSVTDCSRMFVDCYKFNQPITIPDSVTSCPHMLYDCKSFNQPITVPGSVTNCSHMFGYCKAFNQPVTIPDSVTKRTEMFEGCPLMNEDGTPKVGATSFTFEDFCSSPDMLLPLLTKGINHIVLFKENFPNGASSKEEVINKIQEA